VALDPADEEHDAKLTAATGGLDHAVDTSGQPTAIRSAVAALAQPGSLVLVAAPASPVYEFDARALTGGRGVRVVLMGESIPRDFIPVLLGHWQRGRFPVDRIISTFSFADMDRAVEAMRRHEVIKPVVTMSS
jgi:aryl-alcohol dehydrogenase